MSRLSLTKASLSRQKGLLKTYHDVLPSLDLKRRQLGAERETARRRLEQARSRAAAIVVDYEVLAPVVDVHEAMKKDAPLVNPRHAGNVLSQGGGIQVAMAIGQRHERIVADRRTRRDGDSESFSSQALSYFSDKENRIFVI